MISHGSLLEKDFFKSKRYLCVIIVYRYLYNQKCTFAGMIPITKLNKTFKNW